MSDNQTDQQIRHEKLKEFKKKVQEIKKYNIEEEDLIQVVKDVYKEGNL